MAITRPRLLAGSLAVALVVGVAGGFVWSQTIGDSDDDVLELSDPTDRPQPPGDGEGGIPTFQDFEGEPLPTATVSGPDGATVSTASFVGEPLVINFWHSNCPPCAKELVDFAEIDAETGDRVRFIGVNPLDSIPVMERFAAERGVEYDLFLDETVDFQTALGIAAFPYTIFVTSDGEIVEQTGVIDADGLREKVDNLLEADQA